MFKNWQKKIKKSVQIFKFSLSLSRASHPCLLCLLLPVAVLFCDSILGFYWITGLATSDNRLCFLQFSTFFSLHPHALTRVSHISPTYCCSKRERRTVWYFFLSHNLSSRPKNRFVCFPSLAQLVTDDPPSYRDLIVEYGSFFGFGLMAAVATNCLVRSLIGFGSPSDPRAQDNNQLGKEIVSLIRIILHS